MSEAITYRLFISPQTHVRTTKDERWMMVQTDEYLLQFGKKKYDQRVAEKRKHIGSPNDYLYRRNAIKKYFDYKRALQEEAIKRKFVIPDENVFFRFYIPMPPSWSKKKRNEKCFTLHKSRPDLDNIIKGCFDSLLKEDKAQADYRAAKFWYDGKEGFIEIEVGGLVPAKGYSKFEREDKIK